MLCMCHHCLAHNYSQCELASARPRVSDDARYISYQNGVVVSVGDVPENLTLSQWLVERCNNVQL